MATAQFCLWGIGLELQTSTREVGDHTEGEGYSRDTWTKKQLAQELVAEMELVKALNIIWGGRLLDLKATHQE